MKKVLLALLSIAIAFTALSPAQAEDQKVLAILDTAIDSSRFPSVIQEVCFTSSQNQACTNGNLFMEGKGSASSPIWPKNNLSPVYHGHRMAQVALSANPDIKIVFIRVSNIPASGVSANATDETLSSAIKWVSENSEKYSIDAVSISMAGVRTVGKIKTPHSGCRGSEFTNHVATLSSKNVPVFVATGNDGVNFVGFPSCIVGVVGVGSVTNNLSSLVPNVNRGDGLDLVSVATVDVKNYFGYTDISSGTSTSNAFAAATYVKNNKSQNFLDFLNLLPKILGYSFISK
jgi:hypothetical protein